jgi:hypothetical protein
MKAIEFLKQNRVYEDETIYNSVGEIVGTVSQLMEEYAALRQPVVIKSVCPKCGSDRWIKEGDYCECTECMILFKQTVL